MSNDDIVSWLSYDSVTGVISWKRRSANNKLQPGDVAGTLDADGYIIVQLHGKRYKAHQLAWFLHTGEWVPMIDHENGIRDDNRINNLRPSDATDNNRNRQYERGVSQLPSGSWRATITTNYKQRHIGTYPTRDQAIAARKQEEAAWNK